MTCCFIQEGYDARTPREVIRRAFEADYLSEQEATICLDALDKRNLLSPMYDEKSAREAVELIRASYAPVLRRIHTTLQSKPPR